MSEGASQVAEQQNPPLLNGSTEGGPTTLREAFWTWLRVSMLSFGGPAAQIAVMHRIIVDEKKWLDERRFLHALNFCMLLPGPEAQQLATYVGWLMHGIRGGLMAGLGSGNGRARGAFPCFDRRHWRRRPVRRRPVRVPLPVPPAAHRSRPDASAPDG